MRMRPLAIIAALACAAPAAEVRCGPTDRIERALEVRYNESPRFRGLIGPNALAELWVSPTGSWTFLARQADGVMCIIATGQAGDLLPPAVTGEPM